MATKTAEITAGYFSQVTGIELDELTQEGILGVNRAIDKFNCAKNVRFITYAAWWAKSYITQYINRVENRRRIKKGASTVMTTTIMLDIDSPVGPGGGTSAFKLRDTIPDYGALPDTQYESHELSGQVRSILKSLELSGIERDILEGRLLDQTLTCQAIGTKHQRTRARVQQIESKLIQKLQVHLAELNT